MKNSILVILGVIFFIININFVFACSCALKSVDEYITSSDRVFIGKVSDIKSPYFSISSSDQSKVSFIISKVYKGDIKDEVTIGTAKDSASCGYSFEKDQEYLVYVSNSDGGLTTDLCSGTKKLEESQADLDQLNYVGVKNGDNENDNKSKSPANIGLELGQLIIGAILVLVIAGLIIVEVHISRWIKSKREKKRKRK